MQTTDTRQAFAMLTRMATNSTVKVRDLAARIGLDTDDAERQRSRDTAVR